MLPRNRPPWPLTVAGASLLAGAVGLSLTLPSSPELLSFAGYHVEQPPEAVAVLDEPSWETATAAPEVAPQLAVQAPAYVAAATAPNSAPVLALPQPSVLLASPEPTATVAAPGPVAVPPLVTSVQAVSNAQVEELPARAASPSATPPTATPTAPAPAPKPAVPESKPPGNSGNAPGRNKPVAVNAAQPQAPGQAKKDTPAAAGSSVPPGQVKKDQR